MKYQRHVTNIRRWIGPVTDLTTSVNPLETPITGDLEVDSFVLGLEDDTQRILELAKLVRVSENDVHFEIYGRTFKKLPKAIFKEVLIDQRNDGLFIGKPRGSRARTKTFEWIINLEDISSLIKISNFQLTKAGRLPQRVIRAVQDLQPKMSVRLYK